MRRWHCSRCQQDMSELMLRTHLVTHHDIPASELLHKFIDLSRVTFLGVTR